MSAAIDDFNDYLNQLIYLITVHQKELSDYYVARGAPGVTLDQLRVAALRLQAALFQTEADDEAK